VTHLDELVKIRVAAQGGDLEEALLGTAAPSEIARMIEAAVSDAVGPVTEAIFYARSVGLVAGVMAGHRPVVAKVRDWRTSQGHLMALDRVQDRAANAGLPAPRLLAEPRLLGHAWLTLEEYLPGESADATRPTVRTAMATSLHGLIDVVRDLTNGAGLATAIVMNPDGDQLWPQPHDLRFDFAGTGGGAKWIDEAATRAREVLDSSVFDSVIGHLDWRVENLGFRDERVVAIYDWDSICLAPEAVVVGCAAASFTTDWRTLACHVPSYQEGLDFVADYEIARGHDFTITERSAFEAGRLWTFAYGARCQHSDHQRRLVGGREDDLPWISGLRAYLTSSQ
jgi:hypothetical protein